jgi:hypothetical protein
MKKLDTTQAVGVKGQPLMAGSFQWAMDGIIEEAIRGLVDGVLSEDLANLSTTTGVALSGCTQSGNIIGSGYAYYLGEIYPFDGDDITAYVNDPVVEIYTAQGGLDPITFSDSTTGNVHDIRRLRVIDGVLGSADFDYVDMLFLNNYRLLTKVVNIGDWDMDATASVNVAHGITSTKIRSVEVWIREDTGNVMTPLTYNTAGTPSGYFTYDGTNVILNRVAAGVFDSTSYNATSFNRGFITIEYLGW